VLDTDAIALQCIFGLNSFSDLLISIFVFLSILNESLNVLFGKTTLVVSNGDLGMLGSSLISSGHIHDSVLINFEGNLNLGHSSGGRWNTIEIELTQGVVVLGQLTLSLEDLN